MTHKHESAIKLTLPYPPSANAIWKPFAPPRGKARIILTKEGREYRKLVCAHVRILGGPSLGDALIHVDIQMYRPDRRKRDLDNVRKAVNDGLEAAGVFDNDNQIVSDSGSKRHPVDRDNPRVVVTITPIAGAERQATLLEGSVP